MTDPGNAEALRWLEDRLRRLGVTQALETANVQDGDTVVIGPLELAWGWQAPPRVRSRRQRADDRRTGETA
jgi:hypothetical protein